MTITDINAETRALCDADSTSYPDATLLRRVNAAYEEIVGKIIGLDGTWQFDDTNFTDMPIGTTDLVASQQDYAFDNSHLNVLRASVKNSNGNYQPLKPLDVSEIGVDPSEFMKTAGFPVYYDKNGSSILLYPPPAAADVTLSGGLKVYYQRTADIFTSAEVSTGTKEPGFASPFHMILAFKAALPYCMSYKKDRVALYEKKVMDLEKDLVKFYSKREKDVRKGLVMRGINPR